MNIAIKNTLGGRQGVKPLRQFMSVKMIAALIIISVFSLGALITLSGFADDLRDEHNGRAHALSNSAIGYAGIVELLRARGTEVILDRTEGNDLGHPDVLHVVTLTAPYQIPKKNDLVAGISMLIVMPKWRVTEIKKQDGWVKQLPEPVGPAFSPILVNSALKRFSNDVSLRRVNKDDGTLVYDLRSNERALPDLSEANIKHLQYLEGNRLVSIVRANGKTVLGRLPDSNIYILSDPDILNTMGISMKSRARYARDLMTGLMDMDATDPTRILFDLYIHGFGKTQNLVKVLLTPPFLAATLCLLAAGFLIAWQAFTRFGDPVLETRSYALGKYTLADNGARFIKIAGKETGMATGYKTLLRRRVAQDIKLETYSHDEIEAFLKAREVKLNVRKRWQDLSRDLETAANTEDFLETAKDLHKWRQEIIHDSQ